MAQEGAFHRSSFKVGEGGGRLGPHDGLSSGRAAVQQPAVGQRSAQECQGVRQFIRFYSLLVSFLFYMENRNADFWEHSRKVIFLFVCLSFSPYFILFKIFCIWKNYVKMIFLHSPVSSCIWPAIFMWFMPLNKTFAYFSPLTDI